MVNRLFIPILIFVSIFVTLGLLTTESLKNDSKDMQVRESFKHVSEEASYSIQFPGAWEVLTGVMETDLVVLAPVIDPEDLFRENINIIYAKLDFPITRDEYNRHNIESLADILVDFDLEEAHDVKVDGLDAKKIIFTHTMGVVNAKVMQYLILNGNQAYVVTFTSDPIDFDTYQPKFEKIAATFQFLN